MMWDPEQYWQKARLYAGRALEDGREDWERAFWAALALEFLARSALAGIHPVLNADPQNEANLFYALGFDIKGQPRSLPVHAVLGRLNRLVPEFDKPTKEFCDFFIIVRNRELHTTELAFRGLTESEWLPRYYRACKILCDVVGQDLTGLLGPDTAGTAERLIEALESDKRSDVLKSIAAHKAVFEAKPAEEQGQLAAEQQVLAGTWGGDAAAVNCPACGSVAKLTGELERESEPMYEDGGLFVEETYLAARMECGACDLVLKDIHEIHHAGLDPHFKKVVETDLHAYFEPEYYEEYNNM
jgi:hypothetical protein